MSARLAFRDEVTALFSSAFSNRDDCVPLFENGPNVDMNHSTKPVIACEISYSTSEQAELAENPLQRDVGEILITVLAKEMSGNRVAITIRDEAAALLQRKHIAGAVSQVARMLPNSEAVKGWVGYRAAIPFYHYHL